MTHWTDLRLRRIHQRLEALEAALAQREPRNQCGETCERAKLCATCAQALAQQDEPVQEPVDAHTTTLRALLECCLTWKLDARVLGNVTARQAITALRAALAQQDEPAQEQDVEDAIEAAYWHFDARKKGLNEWAYAPQSERDAFKAEARKLVRGYFPTRQAQDTKREMLAVADAFIRGKRAALAQQENKTPITDDHGKALLPQYQVIEQSGNWLLLYDQMQVGEKVRHEFRIQKLRHDVALYPGITLAEAQKRFRERVEADHE